MDIVSLIGNLFILTFFGVMIAFSPLLIMVNMIIVLTTKRPIFSALILMAGVATPLLLIALLAELFIDPAAAISFGSVVDKIGLPPLIDLVVGLALVVFGLNRAWNYRSGEVKKEKSSLKPPTDSVRSLFAFGFFKSLLSATNIFAVLFVVKLTKVNELSLAVGFLAFCWTLVIGLLPFLMALYYQRFRPDRLKKFSDRLESLLNVNIQLMVVVATLLVGSYLSFSGLQAL